MSAKPPLGPHHLRGQRRAELFELIVGAVLRRLYPTESIGHDVIVRPEGAGQNLKTIDFLVSGTGPAPTLVEVKAPYSDSPSHAVNRSLRRLKTLYDAFPNRKRIRKVIFVLAGEMPQDSVAVERQIGDFFREHSIDFEVWDGKAIRSLAHQLLGLHLTSFELDALELAAATLVVEVPHLVANSAAVEADVRPDLRAVGKAAKQFAKPGRVGNVVVSFADFCSFSRFVKVNDDSDTIRSIMGRFYRESRRVVEIHGGHVDKFIGDGLLCFWREPLDGGEIDACFQELIGLAVRLANEWQDLLDEPVEPKGMRIGAAIGTIEFIEESEGVSSPIHAIGDCINLAVRLQSKASANSIAISNKLRNLLFENDLQYEKAGTDAKNIGEVIFWKKDFEKT